MEQPKLTRRSLLATVPVATAAIAMPTAATATDGDAGLDVLIAKYKQIEAEAKHYDRTVHGPAHAALDRRVATIPHVETVRQIELQSGKVMSLSTADQGMVRMVRAILHDARDGRGDDFLDCCRELAAAADERDAQIESIRADLNIEEIDDRSDAYGQAMCEVLHEIEDYPVTTLAGLMRKIEALRHGLEEDNIWDAWTLADLHRIAGRA